MYKLRSNTCRTRARFRQIVGKKIQDGTGQFNYLVEGCDPCEANNYGYTILGVVVSDFITPHFYDPVVTQGTRYSFTGAITAPRQILPGGYISFVDQETDEWQQILWVDPSQPPQLKNLGPATGKNRSMREWVDNEMTKSETHKKQEEMIRTRTPKLANRDHQRREKLDKVASMRAQLYAK
jgi:hypothetical protein